MSPKITSNATNAIFRPLQIGPHIARNRIFIPGMSLGYLAENGGLGERYRAYLARRAAGGAAVVGIGSSPVHPSSAKRTMQPELWRPEVVSDIRLAADSVHAEDALLSIILWHGGRHISHRSGRAPLGPSQVASADTSEVPKAASKADIRELISGYGIAADHCVRGGIDILEVQTASDYLLGSFLSPRINRRTDEYGGSPENRRRIVVEVLEKVREKAAPGTAVGVRTSVEHLVPHDADGYMAEDSLEHISALAKAGLIDYVSLMTGSHYWFPGMISPAGIDNGPLLAQAEVFRRVLNIPVVVAGGIRSVDMAVSVLAGGQADAVGMARAHLADPDWTRKLEAGDPERIRPCIACNQACIGFAIQGMAATCIVNPGAGHEYEPNGRTGTPKALKVAVVGGGPAGLEAARIAARNGHDVTLYEARGALGGAMALAAGAPHRGLLRAPVDWWQRELERLDVSIRLDYAVNSPGDLDVDRIIWATGSVPGITQLGRTRPQLADGIPGTENALHGREVLGDPSLVSGNVLVIDEEGGWPAVSTVEILAAQAQVSSVTVTTDRAALGLPELFPSLEIGQVTQRLSDAGIEVRVNTLVDSVTDGRVMTTSGYDLGAYDSIVLCTGAESTPVPDGVTAVGDCVAPRSIWAAVSEGQAAARRI